MKIPAVFLSEKFLKKFFKFFPKIALDF